MDSINYPTKVSRRSMYAFLRAKEAARNAAHPDRAWLPLAVSRDTMKDFASVAPRQTRWSYSVPGVCEGDADSHAAAIAACESAYRRTSVTHCSIYARVDGIVSIRA